MHEINKRKPFLSIVTGDFNARSSSWWPNDINTAEGTKLFSIASSNGFSQLINEPTHIQTSSSSCLDLIFTDQPNLSNKFWSSLNTTLEMPSPDSLF